MQSPLLTIKLFLTFFSFFQNEKEQILTTNVWLNLVSTALLRKVVSFELDSFSSPGMGGRELSMEY